MILMGGGELNHSVAVKEAAATTPHHGSEVRGPLTVDDDGVPGGAAGTYI
jgi:hypothetical protein